MNVLENDTAELQQEGKGRQPAVPSSEEGCYPSEEQEDKEAAKAVAVPAMRLSPGPQTGIALTRLLSSHKEGEERRTEENGEAHGGNKMMCQNFPEKMMRPKKEREKNGN